MAIEDLKDNKITQKIIGLAMKVHRTLGSGFQELIYQRALEYEFECAYLDFAREVEMTIFYDGHDIGTRRVDFLVDGKIIVELKAMTRLEKVHLTQALNYLEIYNLETALLINFGALSLEFNRLRNKKYNHNNPKKSH